ncbi:MAG: patatin-like phospholipase family protein [Bacteroidota bacterium]
MKKRLHIWRELQLTLPMQLLVRQLRRHRILLLFWSFLIALITGVVGKGFGGIYLFMEPEYLGEENFWSVFIVGSALGAFLFAYMITLYINESYRFPFIALTKHPFYIFAYNNFLLPGAFLIFYLYQFFQFHVETNGGINVLVWQKTLAMILGIGTVFLISATYFFTQRGLFNWIGSKLEKRLARFPFVKKKKIILGKARSVWRTNNRTHSYLLFPFQLVQVEEPESSQFRTIVRALSQHHGKLLLMQILTFTLIATLGLLEDNPAFQIPAGASFLLIFSLGILILGAISFWSRKSGMLTLITILAFLTAYNHLEWLHAPSHALGMEYQASLAPYTEDHLASLHSQEGYEEDRLLALNTLDSWLARYQEKHGYNAKPKAVFVSASGGGLRSAYWTLSVLQQLDSLTKGQLSEEIRLMTGASGGMFGQTYFRELYLQRLQGELSSLESECYRENISKDLLNRIIFKVLSDMFLPNRKVFVGDNQYYRETGYSFDDQLGNNLPEIRNKRLGDYQLPEAEGLIPQIIYTPTILNQGKQLYISANPISYLTQQNKITDQYLTRTRGVEFRRFFEEQEPDSLLITTALRMNATFPFVLPVVELPSEPAMMVMDAGAIDNYGTQTAVKYLFEFKEWFAENTEGIIFLQIRDNRRIDPIRKTSSGRAFQRITAPLGGGYYSLAEAKDLANDNVLEFIHEWYSGYVEVIPIEYPRETSDNPASLSFHLTSREKTNISLALSTPQNEAAFQLIQGLYQEDLIASSRGKK